MSSMIECDSCKKKMYADSRSAKGDYHEFWLDSSDQYHISRKEQLSQVQATENHDQELLSECLLEHTLHRCS